MDLGKVASYEFVDMDSDPRDAATVRRVEGYMAKRIQRAEGLHGYETLKRRGDELRQRMREVGVQREPVLVIVGEK